MCRPVHQPHCLGAAGASAAPARNVRAGRKAEVQEPCLIHIVDAVGSVALQAISDVGYGCSGGGKVHRFSLPVRGHVANIATLQKPAHKPVACREAGYGEVSCNDACRLLQRLRGNWNAAVVESI